MKPNHPFKRVSVDLDVLQFPTGFVEEPAGTICLHCDSPLILHQPDLNAPTRLLGVCDNCKHWFLIDVLADMTGEIMLRLPDVEIIRDLSCENPADGISLMGEKPD